MTAPVLGKGGEKKQTVLEFIDGEKEEFIYGAWDYVSSTTDNQTMDKLIAGLRRGK